MSDDNKEGAGVPVAYVVRDAEGGSLHDFTDYYNADQFWIRNRSRMLKPQFLFCYDAPAAAMPAAPSDAAMARLRWAEHVFSTVMPAVCSFELDSFKSALRDIRQAISILQTMRPQAPIKGAHGTCRHCGGRLGKERDGSRSCLECNRSAS